ncbi:putative membrane protein [Mesocricetibacter intestinalis]|uniref:Putative membrane protein n=1 Tax=Mesocricetibacter intestinalis TaxID=1521930 RepID=A0A4R6V8A4_9PAST|nr:hypothetical protein [Mesocricetibacter intestinalis]TDQ57682.1 putative membrane protein [Mesocricetibacter intestinalis]
MRRSKFIPLIINILISLTSLAYPLIWLMAPQQNQIGAAGLAPVLALLWFIQGLIAGKATYLPRSFSFAVGFFFCIITLSGRFGAMYWYPVLMNGLMLLLFGASLFSRYSLVERLARLQTPDLPQEAILYTRRVTQLWCAVFILNILITASLILLHEYYYWALFSGLISYIIMALVMSAEWLVRRRKLKKYR